MQGQPKYYKIVGFVIALIGLRLFTVQKIISGTVKPSYGWWGIIVGTILIGLGWGVYDVGRNITKHQTKATKSNLDGKE